MGSSTIASTFDFTSYVADHARDFTGRQWVFAEIDRWLATPYGPRYFMITGEPGIGKSAIAAHLVQVYDLAAIHFCIPLQQDTIDPLNFTRSLSHQLTRLDGFAQYIMGAQAIYVSGEASASQNYGSIIGVNINTLVVQAPSATVAFNRVIADPLRQLYAEGFDKQLVILVDALDEAAQLQGTETIVSLLAGQQHLPDQVRFIVTTRPESEALRHFEQAYVLPLITENDENIQDLRTYIRSQVESTHVLQARLTEYRMQPQTLIDSLVIASQGNFLYLFYLLQAIAAGTQRLDAIDALPQGLDGFYRQLLRLRIGKNISSWRTTYRPLLGMLVVARAPLTTKQLMQFTGLSEQEVDDVLLDVQEFLAPTQAKQGQYQLYHRSIAEFLRDKQKAIELWIDPTPMNKSVVSYYRGEATNWDDVKWSEKDEYGLLYLSWHLYVLSDINTYRQELYKLLCKSLMQAKFIQFGSHRPFAVDVALSIQVASSVEPHDFVQEVRGSLIYAALGSMASHIPPELLAALTQMGQLTRAINFVLLMQDANMLIQANQLIVQTLLAHGELEQAYQVVALAMIMVEAIADQFSKSASWAWIARTLAQLGQTQQALEAVERIEDRFYIVEALDMIIPVMVQQGQLQQALEVVETMGNLMSTSSKFEELDRVILGDLRKASFGDQYAPQDKVGFLILKAQILAQQGDQTQTISIIDQVLTAGQAIEPQQAKIGVLQIMIRLLAQIGQVQKALEVVETMEDPGEKVLLLNEMAQFQIEKGEVDRTLIIANQALTIAQTIEDPGNKLAALTSVARNLAKQGEQNLTLAVINQAILVIRTNVDLYTVENVQGAVDELIRTLTELDQVDKALEVVETMGNLMSTSSKFEELDRVILGDLRKASFGDQYAPQDDQVFMFKGTALIGIAQILAERGEQIRGLTIVNQALAVAQTIRTQPDKARMLGQIAPLLTRLGQIQQALEVARTVEDRFSKAEALSKVAQVLAQRGEQVQAEDIVNQALAATQTIKRQRDPYHDAYGEYTFRERALRRLAQALVQLGQVKLALEVMETKLSTDGGDALVDVAQMLAQLGQVERALEIAETMPKPQLKANALSTIASTLAEQGEQAQAVIAVNRALATAQAITDQDTKEHALEEVAQALAQVGQVEQSCMVVKTIEDQYCKSNALKKVVQLLIQREEQVKAITLVNQVLAATQMIKDEYSKLEMQGAIAQSLAQLGQVTQALQIVNMIGQEYYKAEALCAIASVLAQRGEQFQALTLTNQALEAARIIDQHIRGDVLEKAAQVLAKLGLVEQALAVIEMMPKLTLVGAGFSATRGHALRAVAQIVAQGGQVKQILKVVEATKPEKYEGGVPGELVEALVKVGLQKQAMDIIRTALTRATFRGREDVFKILVAYAVPLGTIYQGRVLWQINEVIHEVDGWGE